jgi:protein SCO1/2
MTDQCDPMGETKGGGMARFFARAAILLLITMIAATAWISFGSRDGDRFAQCRESQVAGGADSIGGPFTLIDKTGRTVTDADVITGPTLIYFGYTFCPDVCPIDTVRNAEAVDILEERGIEVTPVFISIDPARDTPEVVGDFAANIHPRMIGLTGTEEQVRAASLAYRTYFAVQPAEDEFYLVDHSTFTYLVLPEVGFVDFFRREATPDEIADRVACFIGAV